MVTFIDIARAAKPLLSVYGFQGATVFGSYARGEAHEGSDIDVYVYVPEETKAKVVFAVASDLSAAMGVEVDAYGSNEVDQDSNFYREIVTGGVFL